MKSGGGLMDVRQAIVILEFLSNGMDPYTGQPLPYHDTICHPTEQEETIEAFQIAIKALRYKQVEEKKTILPKNTNTPWTKDDIDFLLTEFVMGRPIEDIAYELERSVSSIRSKLFKLGKIVFEL